MLGRLIGEDIVLVTLPGPSLAPIKANAGQIEQVIMNLAVNARDAMPLGGRLTIETANVSLDGTLAGRPIGIQPGPYVLLAVSDTGCGMDAEIQSHLFEPFFTTKESGKGTGLGLATVYGIVKQIGGHIEVRSDPGRGARFEIYLPRTEEAVSLRPVLDTPAGPYSGSETILLVEDEPLVRRLVRDTLERSGYSVLEASHGEEALRLCEKYGREIQLLVTDVVMPEMSGPELAAHVAAVQPELKVLFISGYTDVATVHQGVLENAPYLQKPFTPGALVCKVREILG
jgi:two-component system, cell cycle sensor histidine kinase and response regulator CckA